jgi:hypothetical protein
VLVVSNGVITSWCDCAIEHFRGEMIVGFLNEKGAVGKTTLVTNL